MFVTEEDLGNPEVVGTLVGDQEEDEEGFSVILPNGRDQLGLSMSRRNATWAMWTGVQGCVLLLPLQVS